jgi:hypothetical protein
MVDSASVDPDTPRERASVVNHSFSSGESRMVIEGSGDRVVRQVT